MSVARADAAVPAALRRGPLVALVTLLMAFAVAYTYLSQLRYEAFFGGNWDLGINMQLLWTTTHGQLMYDAGDFELARANSFLFVHPALIAIPLSAAYWFSPTPTTLFAIQGVAVALAAVPLYLIGCRTQVPLGVLFAALAVFLASFPMLSALLFDFHWEAFIPAEFLWTYYLWSRGRYRTALVPAVLGLFTLEVFPVLLVGLVVYFAYPFLRAFVTRPREALGDLWARPKKAAPLAGLLAFAIVGQLSVSAFASHVVPLITGLSPVFPAPSPNFYLGVYWWGVSASNLGPRLLYWFLVLGAFGFLPLLVRQRLLILSLPWFLYSVVMIPYDSFTQFGFQYSFIAAAPLAIAFVEGTGAASSAGGSSVLRRELAPPFWLFLLVPFLVAGSVSSLTLLAGVPAGVLAGAVTGAVTLAVYLTVRLVLRALPERPTSFPRRHLGPRRQHTLGTVLVMVSFIVLITSNVVMSPLNPANDRGVGYGGYSFSGETSPLYPYMPGLTDKIPAGASVVATSNLFPFVANNPNAYSLLWYPATPPFFPFNASHLPRYVLLSTSEWYAVPDFLESSLFNSTQYGIVTMLYSSAPYPGSLYLFQLGYSGPSQVLEVSPFPRETLLCPAEFALGASGEVVPASGTECGTVVQSVPAGNLSGSGPTIWYGPYSTLIQGNYTVNISIRGHFPIAGIYNPAIVRLNANAAGTPIWYDVVITSDEISATNWTTLTYHFTLQEPHPRAEWRGYLAGATVNGTFVPGFVQLNYIEVSYHP